MKNNRKILFSIVFMLVAAVSVMVVAQQKKEVHRGGFVGKWKLNKPKSDLKGPFPVCTFGEGDRLFSNTMTIAGNRDLLTIQVTSSFPEWEPVKKQEKLIFDGKEREATGFGWPRDESTARYSDDGQTMVVTSFKTPNPKAKDPGLKITEVWKLIDEGNAVSVAVNLGKDTRKLVYDRQN